MKDKILFINACVRYNSRTVELSRHLLNILNGEITEVNLYKEGLLPLYNEGIEKRALHDFSGREFEYAKQFSKADSIVIGAPFWDLSFPAVLKLYYITTSGGYIGQNNFGFDYVKALAENFFGINDISFYSAEGLDIFGADVKEIIDESKKKITNEL